MRSPQTLSEADRRLLAGWAAECAARVLPVFLSERPEDDRPRLAIDRARAFARGVRDTASEIRDRFGGGTAAKGVSPAAAAAARAAGQTSAIAHMGAHALGAAAYAVLAAERAAPDRPETARAEIDWQLTRLTPEMRAALAQLPTLGTDRAGPLGPGLLSRGRIGEIILELQSRL